LFIHISVVVGDPIIEKGVQLIRLTPSCVFAYSKSEFGCTSAYVVVFCVQWFDVRYSLSFCWHWYNCWPSLFKFLLHNGKIPIRL